MNNQKFLKTLFSMAMKENFILQTHQPGCNSLSKIYFKYITPKIEKIISIRKNKYHTVEPLEAYIGIPKTGFYYYSLYDVPEKYKTNKMKINNSIFQAVIDESLGNYGMKHFNKMYFKSNIHLANFIETRIKAEYLDFEECKFYCPDNIGNIFEVYPSHRSNNYIGNIERHKTLKLPKNYSIHQDMLIGYKETNIHTVYDDVAKTIEDKILKNKKALKILLLIVQEDEQRRLKQRLKTKKLKKLKEFPLLSI